MTFLAALFVLAVLTTGWLLAFRASTGERVPDELAWHDADDLAWQQYLDQTNN